MGRPHRAAEGSYVFHVLNRANARLTIFEDDGDYAAFETILQLAVARFETRLLAYCVMPNHWHLILWPRTDGELFALVGWLTLTHTQRWHAHRRSAGSEHVIPRAIQVVSNPRGPPLFDCRALRGAKRPTCESGEPRPEVAVGQPLPLAARVC